MRRTLVTLVALLVLLSPAAWGTEKHGRGKSASLLKVDGVITRVYESPGEGGIPVLAATLTAEDEALEILLAPRGALEQIGFDLLVGDEVRVRIFRPAEGEAARVHKILNRTRGAILRLRTLRHLPLWDGSGRWQGSNPGRSRGEDGGHRGGAGRGR